MTALLSPWERLPLLLESNLSEVTHTDVLKTYNWDGWTGGWIDGWMDGTCRGSGLISVLSLAFSSLFCTGRWT